MKREIATIYIAAMLFVGNSFGQAILKGKITDKLSKEPILGATVYLADLKTGAVSDANGNYLITNLPEIKLLIQVKLLGYSTISEIVDLNSTLEKNFELGTSAIEAAEIVVTGSPFTTNTTRSSLAVVPVDRKQIQWNGAGNIVKALENIPGVSGISTGGAITKPVIRGLGYNRIVVVNEGVRQEGQQWGDEHGLEIDQFAADRIEILKGPGSLLYGSDALGGVINILEPVPAPSGITRAELNSQFSTNNGLTVNSLMAEGNHKGFVWRGRGTYKNAAAFKTPDGYIYNSAFNENDFNLLVGVNRKWGFSHLHLSRFETNLGLIEGERDSATGMFTDIEGNIVPEKEMNTRIVNLPKQNIQHTRASLVNTFFIGKGQLKVNGGWQQNERKEFEVSGSNPGLHFQLNTITADARYYFSEYRGLETVLGISGMRQQNKNKGNEFLIPGYKLADGGAFVSVKRNFVRSTISAGIRYDVRSIKGKELMEGESYRFVSFSNSFQAISGSIGTTYEANKYLFIKANAGRGFRTPNISELAANGIHEGTFRYEIGNNKLKPETSLQFDAGVLVRTERINAELSAFCNLIDNFIYYRNVDNEMVNLEGELFPAYRYIQGNALLHGFEFSFDFHLLDELHFENTISYVQGTNAEISKPLPFIPATHFSNILRYNFETGNKKLLNETYLKIGLDNYLKQDRFDEFETETDGYTLLSAGAGTTLKIRKQQIELFINGENLLDKKYTDHLNRLKETGIANPGRNLTFGLRLPVGKF